jgi:hypothetical protein
MNMVKLNKHIYIFFLTFIVIFLFGCSEEQQQKASVDTKSELSSEEVPIQEAVNEKAEETKEVSEQELSSQENPEAKQKLAFAQNNLKMAQKGILSYSQVVVLCRDIIRQYPGTPYERQARTLLRQVPEDLRSQFNITDEELEL